MERSKNIFDKIGSLIPGYRGYAERDGRRNCDKLLRNKISEEIIKCETSLNTRLQTEVKSNNLDSLQDLEECRQKLNTLSDKIKYAPYGESSFFGESQIKEDELQKIYQLDYDILLFTNKFLDDIPNLEIADILVFIDSLTSMLEDRNNFIKEHK
jgi:hypothetical protein